MDETEQFKLNAQAMKFDNRARAWEMARDYLVMKYETELHNLAAAKLKDFPTSVEIEEQAKRILTFLEQ